MIDLGTLGGPNSAVYWPVKDDIGLITGVSDTSDTDPLGEDFCAYGTGLTCRGFLWHDGKMIELPTLGGNNGQATAVNNRGQVVGYAENSAQPDNRYNDVPWQTRLLRSVITPSCHRKARQFPF